MSATLASIKTSGYHIIDTEIVIPNSITIGSDSTLHFCGGSLKNETGAPIILTGNNVTIEAGAYQIFNGDFVFRSSSGTYSWIMERAYPQWFGAKDCSVTARAAYEKAKNSDPTGMIDLQTLPDASAAINAAIQLKQKGEVFIPRGWYKISKFINVLPGIQLRGEAVNDSGFSQYGTMLFPWRSNESVPSTLSYLRTDGSWRHCKTTDFDWPLHNHQCNWYNNGHFLSEAKETGYMVLVNIDSDANQCSLYYDANSQYPKQIRYRAIKRFSPPETEISNICFIDLNWLRTINFKEEDFPEGTPDWQKEKHKYHPLVGSNDCRFMRCILAAYTLKLSNVRFCGFCQALDMLDKVYNDPNDPEVCADERLIDHCNFHPPYFNPYSGFGIYNDYTPDYISQLFLEKLYAFDLGCWGDAMMFYGNHIVDFCENIGALHLRCCNGGSITDNILNSDVLIEICHGIDITSNHFEYGANLTIASSMATVRDNFFWRGTRPSIIIRRHLDDAYAHYHSTVELTNNSMLWRAQHTEGQPQAAQSLYEFDIRIDGYAAITINNTFRHCLREGTQEGSYFGIQIQWLEMERTIVDGHNLLIEDEQECCPFEEFNRISHIASVGSRIVGRRVTPISSTIIPSDFFQERGDYPNSNVHFLIRRMTVADKDKWHLPAGSPMRCTYNYRAWIFADFKRRLLIPNTGGGDSDGAVILGWSYLHDDSYIKHRQPDPAPTSEDPGLYNLRLMIGKGEYSNYNVPAGPYWLYIERLAEREGFSFTRSCVTIPISNSTCLWDDGQYLSGYEWQPLSDNASQASEMASTRNLRPSRITYHGSNVECLLPASPSFLPSGQPYINGEWLDGDVIKWVANGTVVVYEKVSGVWVSR